MVSATRNYTLQYHLSIIFEADDAHIVATASTVKLEQHPAVRNRYSLAVQSLMEDKQIL